jgi:antitoxin ParD1/3/4
MLRRNTPTGHQDARMSTMNIPLPDGMKSFVDQQVASRGFGTSSGYIRELIRKEQERLRQRAGRP